jgi:hypothetical protein
MRTSSPGSRFTGAVPDAGAGGVASATPIPRQTEHHTHLRAPRSKRCDHGTVVPVRHLPRPWQRSQRAYGQIRRPVSTTTPAPSQR